MTIRRYKLYLLVGDKPCGCRRRSKRRGLCSHPRRALLVPIGYAHGLDELAQVESEIGFRLFHARGHTLHRRSS